MVGSPQTDRPRVTDLLIWESSGPHPERIRPQGLDAFGISRAGAARAGGEEAAKGSNTGATWDDPDLSVLDDRRGELPPFPVERLPAWGDWLRDAANGGGVTPGHVAVPLLSIASSLIGTARRVRASRAWSEPLALWTGIVG